MPTTIDDLDVDVLTEILRRLDGPALATASCASSQLKALATDPEIWKHLCTSKWPSLQLLPNLPTSLRSFFSDSHPFPSPDLAAVVPPTPRSTSAPAEIVSAVDLYHKNDVVFSNVVTTEARSSWFLSSPFRVDAMENMERMEGDGMAILPEELRLSWIVIDPEMERGVNVSSRRPVSVTKHWYTGHVEVKFATVMGSCAAVAVVVVGGEGEGGEVREVSMRVEGMNGQWLDGRESLGVVMAAVEGRRRGGGVVEAEERYLEYERRRRERTEKKTRSEGRVDFCCMVLGVVLFLGSMGLMAAG